MNLLGNHYLGSSYSVTEARVFFEIYSHEGCLATHIVKAMNIDKSYLSRLIRSHEKNGYIHRERVTQDGRSFALYLTEEGRKLAENMIAQSNAEIAEAICHLSENETRMMIDALAVITKLLNKGKDDQK
ncbi:MAG: MarR family winged helix-turn-helix transcriptional regulator [Clostridia bacterium]|nr:MarR family winged helix-turn-helix transcriptional regulator [Clostridia bacterium]